MLLLLTRHASGLLKREEGALTDHTNSLEETPALSRRAFTLDAALAILAGCVITVTAACDDDDTPTNPSPPPSDISGTISANHGHTVTVTAAQITAGNAVVLTTVSTGTHTHTVSLSQANLQTLANRQPVTVESSTDALHSHTVTFTPM
jgi:hypothetical protein